MVLLPSSLCLVQIDRSDESIGILHSDNPATAALAMGVFALGVSMCILLLASHDQPFTGDISVGPDLLLSVLPQP
jgi:hypothetical protein